MDELKLIFASNLIRLRTEAGLTQAELASMINYSDKSVSKWERGEAVPDAYVLKQMAQIFHTTVDALLSSDTDWKSENADLSKKEEYSQLSIILCAIVSIFTVCLLEFLLVWAIFHQFHWIVLYAALPVSLTALLVMNSVWYKGRHNFWIVSALVLSLILLSYLLILRFKANLWQLLLIMIPAEIIVWLAYRIKPRPKLKAAENKELS